MCAGFRVCMWALLLLLSSRPGLGLSACPRYDLSAHPLYLSTTADDYDAGQTRFEDTSGNGRHGDLKQGTVSFGRSAGKGASNEISYMTGNSNARIHWPSSSVPSSFTICSVTRYTGAARERILQGRPSSTSNWIHGHWAGWPGTALYSTSSSSSQGTPPLGSQLSGYNIVSDPTHWVVTCGRNDRILANGISTATGMSGGGNIGNLHVRGGGGRKRVWGGICMR